MIDEKLVGRVELAIAATSVPLTRKLRDEIARAAVAAMSIPSRQWFKITPPLTVEARRDRLIEAATAFAEVWGGPDIRMMVRHWGTLRPLEGHDAMQAAANALYAANDELQKALCIEAGQVDDDDKPNPRVERAAAGDYAPHMTPPPRSHGRRGKKKPRKVRR